MDKRIRTIDERKKHLKSLNDEIQIDGIERGKWGYNLALKCLKCGNTWSITEKWYKINPSCPMCREKLPVSEQCGKKLTNEEWIERAKTVHPEYDYSKTEYKNSQTPVTVVCRKHGEFTISPKAFMKPSYKCAKCKKEEKLEKDGKSFIEECKSVHPEYDYFKTKFSGIKKKMLITCPKHGDFYQLARYHILGGCCPKCSSESVVDGKRKGAKSFIDEAISVHGEKYDYSKVDYRNNRTAVCIVCPEHGEFWQIPSVHLNGGGCPKCAGKHHYSKEEIIAKFKKVHGEKYDYSKVDFKTIKDKVCIICHEKDEFGVEHGEFWQTPKNHLKYGCKKCSNSFLDQERFINKSRFIHGDYYDYSKVKFINTKTKVVITCPEHGDFLQEPNSHMNGRGCPLCKTSHLERIVNDKFKKLGRLYLYQYHDKSIFGKQSLDFYFPSLKIAVECQGEQHYISSFYKSKGVEYAEEHLKYIQALDSRKRQLCKENGIELIYFLEPKFEKYETSGNLYFTDTDKLVEYINSKC